MKVIPSLSDKGFIVNPAEMVMEVLYNYVRGNVRQSYLFKTNSLMADLADSNSNIDASREKIKTTLTHLLTDIFDNIDIEMLTDTDEPVMNIRWTYGEHKGKIENINLNTINTENIGG